MSIIAQGLFTFFHTEPSDRKCTVSKTATTTDDHPLNDDKHAVEEHSDMLMTFDPVHSV